MLGAGVSLHADDAVQADTEWTGSPKGVIVENGTPRFNSFDARIVILERDGKDFTAELWWDNDVRAVAIAGTIDKAGSVRFTVTKEIKGESAFKDLIDNGRFRGTLKGKRLWGRVAVPGTSARYGELNVKLNEKK